MKQLTMLLSFGFIVFFSTALNAENTVSELSYEELQTMLNDYKGKVVVLSLFAATDQTSQRQLPELLSLYDEYNSQGVEIIGIALDEGEVYAVEDFVLEKNIPYPVFLGKDDIVEGYKVKLYPMVLILDKTGTIREKCISLKRKRYLESKIKPLL